jgi:hypothetical protein
VAPELGHTRDVDVVAAFGHELEALAVRLHQRVLDPVVDHLHEVSCARGADPCVASRRRQGLEDGLQTCAPVLRAADHQAVTLGQAPDPPGGAAIQELDPGLGEQGRTRDRVDVSRVPAVDDEIAPLEELAEAGDRRPRDLAGGQHDPHGSRDGELRREGLEGLGPDGALLHELVHGRRIEVVHQDLVSAAEQAPRHVRAHPAEADHSYLHPGQE